MIVALTIYYKQTTFDDGEVWTEYLVLLDLNLRDIESLPRAIGCGIAALGGAADTTVHRTVLVSVCIWIGQGGEGLGGGKMVGEKVESRMCCKPSF